MNTKSLEVGDLIYSNWYGENLGIIQAIKHSQFSKDELYEVYFFGTQKKLLLASSNALKARKVFLRMKKKWDEESDESQSR